MTTHHCPTCGNQLPTDAPQGECPRCLLQAAYTSEPPAPVAVTNNQAPFTATRSYGSHGHFQPPSVAELHARIPQYEILELVGQGGMGAVYKAKQPGLGRHVAIKILPGEINQAPSFAERFAREARALALLSHPNIVAVHDFGQTDGLCYFVMEYVDGVNLRQAIQGGKLDTREALAIVPQICDALQFAHDEGVVHRDIKPENILIDKRGRVKIADFGLAKLLSPDPSGLSLTGTMQVMGTLRYMAPEQMSGAKEVDHRADIFSLGVVFYELLTGELPIGRFAPPSKKAQVDARLDDVVLRALEAEPELRYQQASEMKTGVEAARVAQAPAAVAPLAAATPAEVPSEPARPNEPDPNRFWGTPVSMALCLLLSFMLLAFLAYTAYPVLSMMNGPDTELLRFGKQWALGDRVDKIMSALFVAFVALVSGTLWCWWKYQSAQAAHRPARRIIPPRPAPADQARLPIATDGAPRLSKAALWGALLVPLFILAVIGFLLSMVTFVTPVAMHEGNAVAARPAWIGLIIMIPLGIVMLFGFLSPFLTTILGVVAISNIRHSRGKLYGMPLAVFDALLYPLLLLDLILLGGGWFLIGSVLRFMLK